MSDRFDEFDDTTDGSTLRKKLEEALAENKNLREKLTQFEQKTRTQEVLAAVKGKLSAKVAAHYPLNAKVDAQAIAKWAEEEFDIVVDLSDPPKGDSDNSSPSAAPAGNVTTQTTYTPDEVAQMALVQQAGRNAQPPTVDNEVLGAIRGAKNRDDVLAAIKAAGGKVAPTYDSPWGGVE